MSRVAELIELSKDGGTTMLYDPKWEVKADPISLPALIAWLETKPANKTYCYMDHGQCLAAQYNRSIGRVYDVTPYIGTAVPRRSFYQHLEWVAHAEPRTFGAALARARAAQSSAMGTK